MRAAVALGEDPLGPGHPRLGEPTTNPGTIPGGQQTDLVPDAARLTVDLRTVPGTDVPAVKSALLGPWSAARSTN
ncbi:hypothetical protein GCM10022223_61990 [Kineosporia mesophila]|uniref:Peptidase M20 dimerisation domain-containing protein n=1 Tax=Kineosporia mesophila TaxID=566012 RepID=A0ABP7AM46_9ACTN|nr:peptidase dimerization domain-containing protein [Kineosporia mesophila]